MKRTLAVVPFLAIVGLLFAAPGVALGDQAFQTVRGAFSSLNESTYPLKGGFVVSTHMNGPIYFEEKEFQLHGAKPDTQFFIYRVFAEAVGPIPAGTPLYAGFSISTDDHGNGHIITPLSPENASLQLLKSLGVDQLTITNVLYDGLLVKDGGTGGSPAYATDPYVSYFDWTWTP